MSRYSCILVILYLAGAILVTVAATAGAQSNDQTAEDPATPLLFGFETDFASRYLDRGMLFSDGAVSQSSLWISRNGLTGSIWTNYDFNAAPDSPSLNEVDLAVAWEKSFRQFDVESSVQTFSYPGQTDIPWTAEISLSISWSLPAIQPYTAHRFDVKEYPGAYYGELGMTTAWTMRENLQLNAGASLGWGSAEFNDAYLGGAVAALQLVMLDIGATWNLLGGLYVRPHLAMAAMIDRDIRALVEDASPMRAGVAIGGEF